MTSRKHNGWIGTIDQVTAYLSTVDADKTPEGEFKIGGAPPVFGMGGEEIVIPDETVYYVDGHPKKLAAGLGITSYGVGVKVYNPTQIKRLKNSLLK